MADESADRARTAGELRSDDSAWAHDIPAPPAPPLPEAWTRLAADDHRRANPLIDLTPAVPPRDEPSLAPADQPLVDTEPANPRPRRSLLVGAVALVMSALVVVRVVGGGGDEGEAQEADAANIAGTALADSLEAASPTTPPTTVTLKNLEPRTPIVLQPVEESGTSPDIDSLPAPEPEWVSGPITLAPRLTSMTVPTQIIVLNTDGVVHVIDAPIGVMHSIDTDLEAPNLAIAVGDSAMIVYSQSYSNEDVTLLHVGGALREVEVPGGTSQIVARPGTDDFLLGSDAWVGNEPPPETLVVADGSTSEVTSGPSRDYGIWGLRYLPATGEAIVNDSGGVYAIDRAGLVRRLSPGTLVAVGDNHVLARECDDSLRCAYARIDGVSGERTAVTAPGLDQYRGYDSSLSLSPDGTLMAYFDWVGSPLARRVLDFDAGTSEIVDSVDQYNNNTSWAADSSGLFIVEDRRLVLYDRATGDRVDAAPGVDLGNIVAVATRPLVG